MAGRIIWTGPAIKDLRDAFDHIRRDSEANAAITVGKIVASAGQVAEFPFSGKMTPEFGRPEIRELTIGSYRVVYREKRNGASILRVSHCARLLRLLK